MGFFEDENGNNNMKEYYSSRSHKLSEIQQIVWQAVEEINYMLCRKLQCEAEDHQSGNDAEGKAQN